MMLTHCLMEQGMYVQKAAGTSLPNWEFIKTLIDLMMKQSVVKYFILRACLHTHLGLHLCLWEQLDLTSNHSNSIQSDIHTA